MNIQEALEILEPIKVHCLDNPPQEIYKAIGTGIKSLEKWEKVIDYLDSRIEETKQDMEEDLNNTEWYLGYWKGLNELKTVIGNFMKEVEE